MQDLLESISRTSKTYIDNAGRREMPFLRSFRFSRNLNWVIRSIGGYVYRKNERVSSLNSSTDMKNWKSSKEDEGEQF